MHTIIKNEIPQKIKTTEEIKIFNRQFLPTTCIPNRSDFYFNFLFFSCFTDTALFERAMSHPNDKWKSILLQAQKAVKTFSLVSDNLHTLLAACCILKEPIFWISHG